MKKLLSTLAFTAILALPAQAALYIVFDTIAETLYFDGSVSATTSSGGRLEWAVLYGADIDNADIVNDLVDTRGIISLSGSTDLDPVIDDLELLGIDDTIHLFFNGLSASTTYTLTANPNIVASYSSVDSNTKSVLATLAQNQTFLTPTQGTDLGSVQMVTAVPEPATYAGIFGLCALAVAISRSRLKKKALAA